jgi:capsid protein
MSLRDSFRRLFSGRRRASASSPPALRPIRGRHDAAQDTDTLAVHWQAADACDADAANSLAVRKKLRERMRLELTNNAYARGIVETHANYVIGTGPKLRMQTASPGFNKMVEEDWRRWCLTTGFNHKLRLQFIAKVGDGEGLARLVSNPASNDSVTLDVSLFECDRLTSRYLIPPGENYIDGITFDEYGNPSAYDILRRHPGAAWQGVVAASDYETVDARFIVHWFKATRPGQHRGIPELSPALNLFGQARRHRGAVLTASEVAASITGYFESPASVDADEATPLSTIPIEQGTIMTTPAGSPFTQVKSEQPSTTHAEFMRQILMEEARPLSMCYSIASCDSSQENFSGGRLNRHTYYANVKVERASAETMAVNPVFAAWFRERSLVYRANKIGSPIPEANAKHSWDWPAMPEISEEETAKARQTALATGSTRLGAIYAEDGLDFEDELEAMAAEYGVSVDEMRTILLDANLRKPAATATPDRPEPDTSNGDGEDVAAGSSRFRRSNGFNLRT